MVSINLTGFFASSKNQWNHGVKLRVGIENKERRAIYLLLFIPARLRIIRVENVLCSLFSSKENIGKIQINVKVAHEIFYCL